MTERGACRRDAMTMCTQQAVRMQRHVGYARDSGMYGINGAHMRVCDGLVCPKRPPPTSHLMNGESMFAGVQKYLSRSYISTSGVNCMFEAHAL
jgi:hypothetical protein